MADWLKDFMGRTPFAILGAIGLLSMASQFINLADDIENWLKVWKAVTRPAWEWIAGLIGYEMPNWLKDYLTVGVILAGSFYRALVHQAKSLVAEYGLDREITKEHLPNSGIFIFYSRTGTRRVTMVLLFIFVVPLWPVMLPYLFLNLFHKPVADIHFGIRPHSKDVIQRDEKTEHQIFVKCSFVFVETAILFLIFVASSSLFSVFS